MCAVLVFMGIFVDDDPVTDVFILATCVLATMGAIVQFMEFAAEREIVWMAPPAMIIMTIVVLTYFILSVHFFLGVRKLKGAHRNT